MQHPSARVAEIIAALALAVIMVPQFSACGGGGPPTPAVLRITAVDAPDGRGDETVTWTVAWTGGTAPYTLSINLGGGAQSDLPAGTAALSPYQADFTLVNGSFYLAENHAYLVLISDAAGQTAVAQGNYSVEPAEPPHLSINNINYNADSGLLRVTADPDGWGSLSAQLILPAGMLADAGKREMEISGDAAVADFYVYPEDIMAGATGEFAVEVLDPDTDIIEPAKESLAFTVEPIALGEGVLAAIPRRRNIKEDESVLVVIACGDFPADKPFHMMNGVGVTVNYGAEYADGTLNVGALGGEGLEPDGIWALVGALSFLIPFGGVEGLMIQENDIGGGRVRIDFNVSSIGGGEMTTGGALLNFELWCKSPGTYTLGFQEFDVVKRTYYSDVDSNEYNWADISNDYPGAPNSIIVVPHL